MIALQKKIGHEKWITNEKGEIESVVLPVADYVKLLELLEDYGFGKAMQEAEFDRIFDKQEALRYLENA